MGVEAEYAVYILKRERCIWNIFEGPPRRPLTLAVPERVPAVVVLVVSMLRAFVSSVLFCPFFWGISFFSPLPRCAESCLISHYIELSSSQRRGLDVQYRVTVEPCEFSQPCPPLIIPPESPGTQLHLNFFFFLPPQSGVNTLPTRITLPSHSSGSQLLINMTVALSLSLSLHFAKAVQHCFPYSMCFTLILYS